MTYLKTSEFRNNRYGSSCSCFYPLRININHSLDTKKIISGLYDITADLMPKYLNLNMTRAYLMVHRVNFYRFFRYFSIVGRRLHNFWQTNFVHNVCQVCCQTSLESNYQNKMIHISSSKCIAVKWLQNILSIFDYYLQRHLNVHKLFF